MVARAPRRLTRDGANGQRLRAQIKASVASFEVYHWDRFGRDILLGKVDINTGAMQRVVCCGVHV